MLNNTLLGINIDHIATLRNARGTKYPDPVHAAEIAERAGADSITVHLREDRRHIRDRDVFLLKETVQTRLNLEMALTNEMIGIAEKIQPHNICIVPEKREELTTEGGFDLISCSREKLNLTRLEDIGAEVSFFIDPDHEQIERALELGIKTIEIHTGGYAEAHKNDVDHILEKLLVVSKFAKKEGLIVNAGHGLNYHNVLPLISSFRYNELNIGHAIIARSVFDGLYTAVNTMKNIILKA
ncbi:pyridoxine 5'-phosphate synthase [Paraphotobacterium marinum]